MIHYIRSRIHFFNKLYGTQKIQIAILTILGFLNGLLGSAGIGILIPLFLFFVNKENTGNDIISRYIYAFFDTINLHPSVWILLILVCILFIVKAIVMAIFGYIYTRVALDYELNLKNSIYQKTLHACWHYLSEQKIGHLENTLATEVIYAKNFLRLSIKLILNSTSFIMYIFVAFNISMFITTLTITVGTFIIFIFIPLVRKTRIYAREVQVLKKDIAHQINENVIGLKTIKVSHVEKQVNIATIRLFKKLRQMSLKFYLVHDMPGDALETVGLIFIALVFGISYTRANFNLATFLVVVYLIQKVFGYVVQTHNLLHDVNEHIPYLHKLLVFDKELANNQEINSGTNKFSFSHSLSFDSVFFSYDKSRRILQNISFLIKKGAIIGIIGPSGAGKTTIVDLILRLFQPKQGKIYLDNTEIETINLSEWRSNIGYVSQDIFLKNDTVANNIAFYDSDMTQESIIEAAKMANCYDFIRALPKGFDTIVGERGIKFSGGERQRIVLARVLARKPTILILDEATSALDNESERMIREVIFGLKGRITVIIVAHRLSTVMDADDLLVLENGSIVERGKPQELLDNVNSYFHRVYAATQI